MKKIGSLLLTILLVTAAKAQWGIGVYAGVNFTGEKTDYSNISTLPVDEGGVNAFYGLHFNKTFGKLKMLELETGINKVTKGYTYDYTSNGVPLSQYTKIQTASVPFTLLFNLPLDFDEYKSKNALKDRSLLISFGVGAFASYAVSGKITEEDGSSKKATFSNANRLELGPRLMAKLTMREKFEVFITKEWGSTNTIKNGNGYLKLNSLMMGIGWRFR